MTSASCPVIIARTWTVFDTCLNTSSCVQTIELQDTTAPILTGVPADVTVPCGMAPVVPVIGTDITATDNCSDVEITFMQDSIPGVCENTYDLIRTWTATDSCGNQDIQAQTITVENCGPMVTIDINPNPACLDEDVTFSANITDNYTNPVYQWQHFNGVTWVDIPGATTIPYTLNGVMLVNGGFDRLIIADDITNLGNPSCRVVADSLELIINVPDTTILDEQICDGQVYDFNGTMIDTMGTFIDSSFTNVDGCDSIIILNLDVLAVLRTDLTDSICEGQSILFVGQLVGSTGIYVDTLISSIGCDSIITLDLTVFPTYSTAISDTICDDATYDFLGLILNISGTYVDTLQTINGCDSVITLDLVVNPTVTFEFDDEICEGTPYTFGIYTPDTTGTYIDTFVSVTGCDSIVTLNLTVHPIYDVAVDGQICDGTTFNFNGQPLTVAGTYDTLLQTVNGCDSMVTLNLIVLDILRTNLSDSICDGATVSFMGQILDSTGIYIDTVSSSIGCDSIITLDLTVFPTFRTNVSDTICDDETYDFLGNVLSLSGTYVDTLMTVNGCDSVITLDLVVNPTVTFAFDDEICDGTPYTFGIYNPDSTGTYIDTFVSVTGCDSIVTLNLTVHPTYDVTVDEQICDGTISTSMED